MSDIHILRDHRLGLTEARRLAKLWIRDAEKDHGMKCTLMAGDDHDEIRFEQPGASGHLRVSAVQFELSVTLGFLFKGFRQKIASTLESRFDSLLADPPRS